MSFRNLMCAGVVVGVCVPAIANAALMIVSSVGGAPTGVIKENFDSLPLGSVGGVTVDTGIIVNFTPNAQAVTGSVGGQYAAPFLSGGNGLGFGPGGIDQPNGADATTYLTAGSTGPTPLAQVELILPIEAKYLGILWGSVDTYNTLSFYDGMTLVGTLTGSDVLASPVGNQGEEGTVYVNINSTLKFDRVVATSSQFAFEFDNVAFNDSPVIGVPAPMSLALLGAGLLGLGVARRGQRAA